MSARWLVLCIYCDSWSCETDDMLDGAAQADKHQEFCDGPVETPLAEVGGHP
jgi:hypothetical protein